MSIPEQTTPGKHGSVLVIGGGISGIQSALDLADAGFKVYIVERGPGIGGAMPQLDKTFPTNDCAMCILSPKLVDCGRHKDIELITYAEVMKVEGGPGNFSVEIRKHPRYVDLDKCTGCADCVENCPVERPNEFDQGMGTRKAIFRLYPQAIPNVFAIQKEKTSPCRAACPAGVNAQGYVALISQGKFKEALELVREKLPFAGICGRICHHPCEQECNRLEIDEPIAIRPLKRFIADYAISQKEETPPPPEITKEEKVAIIGAGPCGLTAAADLAQLGYPVEVFDSSDRAGGMITSCLPDYRIPLDMAEYEIDRLLNQGVTFKGNTTIGKDIILGDLTDKGYKAVLVAIGTQLPKKLNIPGHETKGVLYGIPFLTQAKAGKNIKLGKKVIIIGGGNVAIDCAKTARRLGAPEVHLVCLETRDLSSKDRMPAHEWEIVEAEEEGVILHPYKGPKRILAKGGKVCGLETVDCYSVYDEEDRRFNPQFREDSESTLEGDTVIIAIGQDPELAGFEELEITPRRSFKVDEISLQTNLPHVFAGGDIVTGPASVIGAVAQGHEAAISIDRYLRGVDLKEGREKEDPELAGVPPEILRYQEKRKDPSQLPARERLGSFVEIEEGFTEEQAISEAKRCLNCAGCCECLQCVELCERDAIDHEMVETVDTITVGAIIVSPGFDKYQPPTGDSYGFKLYPNVLTSLEFERMLSASGPYKGHITRFSDGRTPKKIAWLQCVGSRDESCDKPYCSSVCCMYATKEAVIAQEHEPGLETHIYFMDMRSFGKDFERYYNRAKDEYGVVYRRCRIPRVEQDRETKDLTVRYVDGEGAMKEEVYDMVVLSVGLQPCAALKDLGGILDFNLNQYGFIETSPFFRTETSQEGIFASGTATEPKDIPESVTQASAASAGAARIIADVRGTEIVTKEYPEERDVSNEEPRIGVVCCHCGINISGTIDVGKVVESAKALPGVVYASDSLYTCSQDSLVNIKEKIKEHHLNRFVIASCTPRTHEPLFQETLREAGLNPHLFEMANIRDQNSWVHKSDPGAATEKAMVVVRMAVSKAAELYPVHHFQTPVIQRALVVGGGIAGMISALAMADQGFTVFLVEKEHELGGHLKDVYLGVSGEKPQELLNDTIELVNDHPRITVFRDTEIVEISGYLGNFTTQVRTSGSEEAQELQHGVVVVATGARPYQPTEYRYGESKDIFTQTDFEKDLFENRPYMKELKEVVMVQCVGSRNDEHPYCSRVCCSQALKNALELKEQNPEVSVYVLYRDIRTYGFREDLLYRRARKAGIIFIRFDDDDEPGVEIRDGKITVTTTEKILGREMRFHPDRLVLSTGIVPGDNEKLSQQLKLPLNQDNFYSEAHVKLRPVDFSADGMYLCGLAHSPRFIEEAIIQAKATAARAATILSKEYLETRGNIAHVRSRNCAGCKLCIEVCSFDAIDFDEEERVARVNEILCQGCGACSAVCPSGVSQQNTFTKKQVLLMIDACLE